MSDIDIPKGFFFDPLGIAAILKTYRLQVPKYQREYSWDKDQIDQLFADFNRAKSESSDYFLGTIVTINKNGTAKPLEIVDGQQRLTTTTILISAIRDFIDAGGQDAESVSSITTEYLSAYDRGARKHVPKLSLNIDDRAFFESLVTNETLEATRESHERLLVARQIASKFVRDVTASHQEVDQLDVLNNWLTFLESSATVILVRAADGSQAFKMFETLNDRGLKTSQADLVKSFLFSQASERISEAQSKWSSMKDNLEEIDDEDRSINFLRHAIVASRQFVRAEQVYNYTQTNIRGEANSIFFLSDLERLSRIYVATHQHSSEYWKDYPTLARRALSWFNQFDLKPIRPLVLALADRFSMEEFSRAMSMLVSLSVRMVITGSTRSGVIEQNMAAAALQIAKGDFSTADGLRNSLGKVLVTDRDFEEAFAKARSSKAAFARYYLRALEQANKRQDEPWFVPNEDPSAITLEHILPQNASNENWPDSDDEEKRRYAKRLGNLCLLPRSQNSSLGDLPFVEKKQVFSGAEYVLTSMLAAYPEWTADQIEDRQAQMARIALKAWPI